MLAWQILFRLLSCDTLNETAKSFQTGKQWDLPVRGNSVGFLLNCAYTFDIVIEMILLNMVQLMSQGFVLFLFWMTAIEINIKAAIIIGKSYAIDRQRKRSEAHIIHRRPHYSFSTFRNASMIATAFSTSSFVALSANLNSIRHSGRVRNISK